MAISKTNHIEEREKAIDIQKAWAIVKKNWLVLKSDRARLIAMFTFPLLMILIYGTTTGVATKGITTTIVNYDNSALSNQVVSAIYADQTFVVTSKIGSQDQAKRMLEAGQIKSAVIIPAGFGNSVERGHPLPISIMIDESDPSSSVTVPRIQEIANALSIQFEQENIRKLQENLSIANNQLNAANSIATLISGKDFSVLAAQTTGYYTQLNSVGYGSYNSLNAYSLIQFNNIGYPLNPNQLLYVPQGSTTSSSFGGLLSSISAQQEAISLEQYYSAQASAVKSLIFYGSSIYSSYQQLAQTNQYNEVELKVASTQIQLATTAVQNANTISFTLLNSIPVTVNNPFGSGRSELDFLLGNILALVIFQGAAAGLGRAIAGERQNGSLTRVFLTPTSSSTIILGTQVFYLILEALRSSLLLIIAMVLFNVTISGSVLDFLFIILIYAIGATGIGMVLSIVAANQEQYQALSLLVIVPTIFLSGVFFPIQTLPSYLQSLAQLLPMAYAADAMSAILVKGFGLTQIMPDILFIAGFGALTVIASIMMFQRELV